MRGEDVNRPLLGGSSVAENREPSIVLYTYLLGKGGRGVGKKDM